MKKINFSIIFMFLSFTINSQTFMDPVSINTRINSQIGGSPSCLVLQNDIAIIGAGKFVLFYDISNYSQPKYLSNIQLAEDVNGLVVDSNLVYVSAWWAGLNIIDFSDPEMPALVGNYTAYYPSGNAKAVTGVAIDDNLAFLFGFQLEVVDISFPSEPFKIKTYRPDTTDNWYTNITAQPYGDYVYISDMRGIRVVNFDDPINPILVGEFLIDSLWNNIAVIKNDKAYLALEKDPNLYQNIGADLMILDVSSSENIKPLSKISVSNSQFQAISIAEYENNIFIGEIERNSHSGKLISIDANNPSNPLLADSIYFSSAVSDIFINDTLCYAVSSNSGISIINFSNIYSLHIYNEIITSAKDMLTEIKNTHDTYYLEQNYPNPFNPITTISYYIPNKSFIKLTVYDILGEEISTLVKGTKSKGDYQIQFDGTNLSSGIYYYTLDYGEFKISKKMLLIK